MKKFVILIAAVLLSISGYSQINKQVQNLPKYDAKALHFGFTLGLNMADFTIRQAPFFVSDTCYVFSVENNKKPGFHLGPVFDVRLGEYFNFRLLINLAFSQRNLSFDYIKDTVDNKPVFAVQEMKLASTFIEAPIQLKYKAKRIDNFRPYVIVGVNPKFDLAARKKPKPEDMPKIKLSPTDIYAEVGFGMDFYLQYFKLSAELKYGYGFLNVIDKSMEYPNSFDRQFFSSIDRLNSKMWMLSFHFE